MFEEKPKDSLDILELEVLIDKAIESEDYEELNHLLDLRERLLPDLPEQMTMEIYERDKRRMELLKQRLNDLQRLTHQIAAGKRFLSSQTEDEKGTFLNRDA